MLVVSTLQESKSSLRVFISIVVKPILWWLNTCVPKAFVWTVMGVLRLLASFPLIAFMTKV